MKEILLVEDCLEDAEFFKECLSYLSQETVTCHHESSIRPALNWLEKNNVDLIFLDLSLPDSFGLATLERMHLAIPESPIIVFTVHDDKVTARQALELGASDYLIKGHFDSEKLASLIARYLSLPQELLKLHREKEKELRFLDAVIGLPNKLSTQTQSFSVPSLLETQQELFEKCFEEYSSLLQLSLDLNTPEKEAQFKVALENLSHTLCKNSAGMEDITDLHTLALRQKSLEYLPEESAKLLERSRYCSLGLLGHIVNYYRNQLLIHLAENRRDTENLMAEC